MLYSSCCSWISHFLACLGNCIGCCFKSQPIIAVDEPSKGLQISGQAVNKPSISDDFWSTSTCDLDSSIIQSQRSLSSIIVSNQNFNQLSAVGSSSNNSEFVNHGLLLWNQSRLLWAGTNRSQCQGKARQSVLTYLHCEYFHLGTSKPFPQPIPLSELVEFLVDIWEEDGLYD